MVRIGKCVLLDATEGWCAETVRLKYSSIMGKEAKSTKVTYGAIRVSKDK